MGARWHTVTGRRGRHQPWHRIHWLARGLTTPCICITRARIIPITITPRDSLTHTNSTSHVLASDFVILTHSLRQGPATVVQPGSGEERLSSRPHSRLMTPPPSPIPLADADVATADVADISLAKTTMTANSMADAGSGAVASASVSADNTADVTADSTADVSLDNRAAHREASECGNSSNSTIRRRGRMGTAVQ